jgi:hypothetical protein
MTACCLVALLDSGPRVFGIVVKSGERLDVTSDGRATGCARYLPSMGGVDKSLMLIRVIHTPCRESQHLSFLSIQPGDQQDIAFQRRIILNAY